MFLIDLFIAVIVGGILGCILSDVADKIEEKANNTNNK